ncbi:MAG: hypothetical protein GY767_14080 [Shimia sp.]|nr:hypothetical protein [Shimia sp.]
MTTIGEVAVSLVLKHQDCCLSQWARQAIAPHDYSYLPARATEQGAWVIVLVCFARDCEKYGRKLGPGGIDVFLRLAWHTLSRLTEMRPVGWDHESIAAAQPLYMRWKYDNAKAYEADAWPVFFHS